MNDQDRLLIFMQTELVAARASAALVAHWNTMPSCRHCSLEMRKRGPLWVCENWRPWNFWRHDVTVRPPLHRSPFM